MFNKPLPTQKLSCSRTIHIQTALAGSPPTRIHGGVPSEKPTMALKAGQPPPKPYHPTPPSPKAVVHHTSICRRDGQEDRGEEDPSVVVAPWLSLGPAVATPRLPGAAPYSIHVAGPGLRVHLRPTLHPSVKRSRSTLTASTGPRSRSMTWTRRRRKH